MKTRTKLITSLALAASLTLGSVAYAKKTPASIFEDGAAFRTELLAKVASLGISDAQRGKIRSVLHSHQPKMEPMVRQMVSKRRELRDLIRGDGRVDETAIRAQCAKIAKLEADLAVERAFIVREAKGTLKPEQIETLKGMRSDVDARVDHVLDQVAKRISEK